MKVISIVHIARAPGTYYVSGPVGLKGREYTATCRDAGDAAAQAVKYAMQNLGGAPYTILGSKEVLDLIPVEVRTKR